MFEPCVTGTTECARARARLAGRQEMHVSRLLAWALAHLRERITDSRPGTAGAALATVATPA